MNKNFDYAEVKEDRKVRFDVKVERACVLMVGWCARGEDLETQSQDQ